MNQSFLDLLHPPPWLLHGNAFIMNYWMSPALTAKSSVFGLSPSLAGRMVQVMLIRYTDSTAGPYDELLLLDHGLLPGKSLSSIPRIFVSTEVSVTHGRRLWGIPKQLAQFEWLERNHICYCQITYRGQTLSIKLEKNPTEKLTSVSSRYIPSALRTIRQQWQSKIFTFSPQFSGKITPLKAVEWTNTLDVFPDFSRAKLLNSFYIPEFELIFPESHIQNIQ